MPRKLRVRQNPVGSFIGGIVGIVFVFIGVSIAIPNAGAFGVFWTLLALVGTISSFYNAFSARGIASEIIEVPDDVQHPSMPTENIEDRLRRLDDLNAKGLISLAEYNQRRTSILNDL